MVATGLVQSVIAPWNVGSTSAMVVDSTLDLKRNWSESGAIEMPTTTFPDDMSWIIEDLDVTQIRVANSVRDQDYGDLDSLAESMKRNRLTNPITVRQISEEEYELVAGERRFMAATKKLRWKKIPARVIKANKDQALDIQLDENTQRLELSPQRLYAEYLRLSPSYRADAKKRQASGAGSAQLEGKTRDLIARRLGVSRNKLVDVITIGEHLAECKVCDTSEIWTTAKGYGGIAETRRSMQMTHPSGTPEPAAPEEKEDTNTIDYQSAIQSADEDAKKKEAAGLVPKLAPDTNVAIAPDTKVATTPNIIGQPNRFPSIVNTKKESPAKPKQTRKADSIAPSKITGWECKKGHKTPLVTAKVTYSGSSEIELHCAEADCEALVGILDIAPMEE